MHINSKNAFVRETFIIQPFNFIEKMSADISGQMLSSMMDSRTFLHDALYGKQRGAIVEQKSSLSGGAKSNNEEILK